MSPSPGYPSWTDRTLRNVCLVTERETKRDKEDRVCTAVHSSYLLWLWYYQILSTQEECEYLRLKISFLTHTTKLVGNSYLKWLSLLYRETIDHWDKKQSLNETHTHTQRHSCYLIPLSVFSFLSCSSLMRAMILALETNSPLEASMDCRVLLLACNSLAAPSRILYSSSILDWRALVAGLGRGVCKWVKHNTFLTCHKKHWQVLQRTRAINAVRL